MVSYQMTLPQYGFSTTVENGYHRVSAATLFQSSLNTEEKPKSAGEENSSLALKTINVEYSNLGGNKSLLGDPLSKVLASVDGVGFYQEFENGAIYWTPFTGAHEVHGSMYKKWKSLGLEQSELGYPVSDTEITPDKIGYYSVFENGAIYWTPFTGARELHTDIYEKWKSLGLERSFLGYPVTDHMPLPDNGSVAYFQGGSIRWHNDTGASEIHSKDYTDYLRSETSPRLPPPPPPNANETIENSNATIIPTTDRNIVAEAVASGIRFPTSMAFLGPNDFLVLEKNDGTVRRIINGNIQSQPLLDVNVATMGERGMLGIAIANHSASEPAYVFLYFTEALIKDGEDVSDAKEPVGNRLYRYELNENGTKLVNPKLLLDIPASKPLHNGGKLLVGPDQNVYLVVGDQFSHSTSTQNNLNGTDADGTSVIYRITQDGEAATGNPFSDVESLSKFYAYGIRNSFGIDFDPVTGNLWDTENGIDHYDEINLVEPGFNSGWRTIQGLSKDNASFSSDNLVTLGENAKYRDPEFVWNQTAGTTALKFLDSDKLGKQYVNDMFVGDIHGHLYHFKLNKQRTGLILDGVLADKVADNLDERDVAVFAKFGGITDLQMSPDGYLYVASLESYYPSIKDQGTIFKIIPSNQTLT